MSKLSYYKKCLDNVIENKETIENNLFDSKCLRAHLRDLEDSRATLIAIVALNKAIAKFEGSLTEYREMERYWVDQIANL